jgi:hypothetical protein
MYWDCNRSSNMHIHDVTPSLYCEGSEESAEEQATERGSVSVPQSEDSPLRTR